MRAHALEKHYTLNEYTLKHLTSEGINNYDNNISHVRVYIYTDVHINTACIIGTPGETEKITCEEDIFRILELPYKEPKDSNS